MIKFFKEKLSKLKNRLFSSYLVKNIFTKVNFNKFLIIFTVGVISRAFVNNICSINVYVDFLHYISILYYIAFSMFIVVVHDIASHTGFSFIPLFIIDFLDFIISKIKLVFESFTKLVYTTIKNSMLMFSKLKYDDFKISFIRKVIKDSNFNFKDKMYLEDLSNDRDVSHNNKDTLLNTYILNKNRDGSSSKADSIGRHHSSSRLHSNGRHHSSGNSRSDSSSNEGIRNNDSRTMNNSVNTSNNVVQSNTNNIEDNGVLFEKRFLVDTLNDGRSSIPLVSRATTVAPLASHKNHNSSFTYAPLPAIAYVPNNSPSPTMPAAPITSRLTTPSLGSMPSVNSVDNPDLVWSVDSANPDAQVAEEQINFRRYYHSSRGNNFEVNVSSPNRNNVANNSPVPEMPRAPIPTNLSRPSTITPLFENPRPVPSISSYSSSNYSNSIASTSTMAKAPNNPNIPYGYYKYPNSMTSTSTYPIYEQTSNLSPTRSYASTNRTGVGLNASNERMYLNNRDWDAPGPRSWLR